MERRLRFHSGMLARGSGGRLLLTAWLAAFGCATGTGGAGGEAPLRCGPGTTEQDGYCVAWDPRGDDAPQDEATGGAASEQPEPAAGEQPAALDACGRCNTDDDCAERCAGTHCERVDGQRLCIGAASLGDAPAAAPGDDACADPCDLWAQCGCGVGQGCAVDGAGALRCAETGTARQGEPCAAERCAAGSTCLADDTCAAYCDDDHPCAAGFACILELQDWQGNLLATVCYGHAG